MTAVVFTISALALVGWILNITALKSVSPQWTAMREVTILCFFLSAAGLTCLRGSAPRRGRVLIARWCGIVVAALGLVTVATYSLDTAKGGEWSWATAPFFNLFLAEPTRMAIITALLFAGFGCVILLLSAGGRRAADVSHAVLLPLAIMAYLVLVGYLFDIEDLYKWLNPGVALNTGIAFFALCLAGLCARPDTWLTSVFTGDEAGAAMARRLLPALLVVPLAIGWLRLHGEERGLFTSPVGVALVAVTYTVCFVALVWLVARPVNRADRRRREAEETMRESEQRYRALVDTAPDAIMVHRDERLLYANAATLRLYGAETFEQLSSRSIVELVRQEERDRTVERIRAVMEGETLPLREATVLRLDGREVAVESAASPVEFHGTRAVQAIIRDITERKREQREREITIEFLQLVNESRTTPALVQAAAAFFQKQSGCEAVGIRLKEGDDYPYVEVRDFPPEFVELESSLCTRDASGVPVRDDAGYPIMECMCGNVIQGRFDPSKPFFSSRGSFWTNSTTQLLTTTTEADRKARTRNRCNGEGYESVALVPLHLGDERLGLLQLNDRRKGMFTAGTIALWERLADYVSVALAKLRADEALLRAKEEWERTFDSVPDLIAILDDQNRIVRANKAMAQRLACTTEACVNVRCYEKVHGSDAPPAFCPHALTLRDGQEHTAEVHEDALGGDFLVSTTPLRDEQGRMIGSVHVARDITQRKRIEKALRETSEYLQNLIDYANAPIIVWDGEFRITRFNHAFERLTGRRANDVAGKELSILFPEDSREESMAHIRQTATGERWETVEIPIQHVDGDTRTVLWNSATLFGPEGGPPVATIAQGQDITSRKEAEEAERAAARRFELLAHTAGELLQTNEPQKVVETLCRSVMELLDCQVFFNFLVDEAAGRLHLNACAGIPKEEAARIEWLDYGVAVCGCVARDCNRIVAEHVQTTQDERTELVKSYGVRAYACHPLLGPEGQVIGTLSFGTRGRETFSEDDLSLMKAVTDQVAAAMVRMRSTRALRESEEQLKRAQEIAHLGSWDLDLVGNHLSWSDEVYRIFGLRPQEFAATYEAFLDAIHPDDRSAVDAAYSGSVREGKQSYEIEHRVLRKATGEVRWVHERCEHVRDASGAIVRSIGMVHDVTERKRAEETLRHTTDYLQNLIDYANAPIIVWDPTYSITRFNHAFERLTGLAADRVLGRDLGILFPEESREQSMAHIRQTSTGERWETVEIPIRHVDGSVRTVLWNSATLFDSSHGAPVATIAQGHDITERKSAEEALRRTADELTRSNRDLEQFAYVASHDLQEPLRMVSGFMQLLEHKYRSRLDAQADQYIHYAVDGAKRMQTLIDDLLAYSRVGRRGGELVPTDSGRALLQALAGLRSTIEESAAEISHSSMPMVRADNSQLSQVFQNLIGNAIKFHGEKPPRVRVDAKRDGDQWVFSVSDNGIGIAGEFREQIFLIFQRLHTKDKYPGTGIGLAICKKIVERHGGRIWVESKPGQGSTFYFSIPD
jgi:PAS domain S-box-containing protein